MGSFIGSKASGAGKLREYLAKPEPILAPGAYDALSARLIEEAGFPVVYMTGFGVTASLLGRPDVGLLTMSEMVGNAHRIVQTVSVPVIADADTGYGNAINVIRTVREYEDAGVAGVHLEDQVSPKRCGHMEGKQVIPLDEAASKIRVAVDARRSPDFVIIARTDARQVEGLEAALNRARKYHEAGADVLFIEALQSEQEIETAAETFPDVPLLFNWAEGGKTPPVPLSRLSELGFRIVIFPISTILSATQGIRGTLQSIKETGSPAAVMPGLPSFSSFLSFIGLPEINELEQRYRTD